MDHPVGRDVVVRHAVEALGVGRAGIGDQALGADGRADVEPLQAAEKLVRREVRSHRGAVVDEVELDLAVDPSRLGPQERGRARRRVPDRDARIPEAGRRGIHVGRPVVGVVGRRRRHRARRRGVQPDLARRLGHRDARRARAARRRPDALAHQLVAEVEARLAGDGVEIEAREVTHLEHLALVKRPRVIARAGRVRRQAKLAVIARRRRARVRHVEDGQIGGVENGALLVAQGHAVGVVNELREALQLAPVRVGVGLGAVGRRRRRRRGGLGRRVDHGPVEVIAVVRDDVEVGRLAGEPLRQPRGRRRRERRQDVLEQARLAGAGQRLVLRDLHDQIEDLVPERGRRRDRRFRVHARLRLRVEHVADDAREVARVLRDEGAHQGQRRIEGGIGEQLPEGVDQVAQGRSDGRVPAVGDARSVRVAAGRARARTEEDIRAREGAHEALVVVGGRRVEQRLAADDSLQVPQQGREVRLARIDVAVDGLSGGVERAAERVARLRAGRVEGEGRDRGLSAARHELPEAVDRRQAVGPEHEGRGEGPLDGRPRRRSRAGRAGRCSAAC